MVVQTKSAQPKLRTEKCRASHAAIHHLFTAVWVRKQRVHFYRCNMVNMVKVFRCAAGSVYHNPGITSIKFVRKQGKKVSSPRFLAVTACFSRNTLIELAIDKFLADSETYLRETQGIDIDTLIEETRSKKFDTVVLSSTGRGFEETFLGEAESPCWYPCRISDIRERNLQYIAIYRGQPVSAITHYAKIKEFRYDPVKKCKVCYFEGDPIALPHEVVLGDRDACYFIGAKYTTLQNLLNVTKTDELTFG